MDEATNNEIERLRAEVRVLRGLLTEAHPLVSRLREPSVIDMVNAEELAPRIRKVLDEPLRGLAGFAARVGGGL